MVSRDGRFVLVYNGEVYNFRELRVELAKAGREFRTVSDTEVVLAAYEAWGEAAFDRFNGMFALAVADMTTGTVVLARDQFGIKPLHIAHGPDGELLFASEIGALLSTGRVSPEPDDATIYRYLAYRVHDDTDRTFFAGVRRLLPGQLARVTADGSATVHTYTRLYADLRKLAGRNEPYDDDARSRFAEVLTTAIRRRLVSDVPVGTALSGGLDSSTVVATLDQAILEDASDAASLGQRQQTFSAIFPGQINDEERYVDAVASWCSDSLVVNKVAPDPQTMLADLADFLRTQQEPVVSTGPYAQYCVMREASRHVTVMIDGQGADELLAGYAAHYLVYLRQLRRTRGRTGAAAGLARSLDVLWRLGRFRVADLVRGRSMTTVAQLLDPRFHAAHAHEHFEIVRDDIKRRLEDDLFRHSLQSLLRYEDRNTMRFSIEGRVPFLNVDLIRALWAMHDDAIISASWNKRALRDAIVDLVPRRIRRRRNKIGFTTPERAWFLQIAPEVRSVFASPTFAARKYWNQATVLHAFDKFVGGRSTSSTMIFWRLLNVELWLRMFVDHETTEPPGSGVAPTSERPA